jgi:GxxExxY protein
MGADSKPKAEFAEEAEARALARLSMSVENALTDRIIGAAIEVHRHLGPGLLESAYEECLCHELSLVGLHFQRQVHLPVNYKGLRLDCAYKMDLVVEDAIIVEIKAIDELSAIHKAQLLTYLRAADMRVGLLINFNVSVLKNGLKRMVNHYTGASLAPCSSAPSAHAPGGDTNAESLLSSSPRLSPRLRVSAVSRGLL